MPSLTVPCAPFTKDGSYLFDGIAYADGTMGCLYEDDMAAPGVAATDAFMPLYEHPSLYDTVHKAAYDPATMSAAKEGTGFYVDVTDVAALQGPRFMCSDDRRLAAQMVAPHAGADMVSASLTCVTPDVFDGAKTAPIVQRDNLMGGAQFMHVGSLKPQTQSGQGKLTANPFTYLCDPQDPDAQLIVTSNKGQLDNIPKLLHTGNYACARFQFEWGSEIASDVRSVLDHARQNAFPGVVSEGFVIGSFASGTFAAGGPYSIGKVNVDDLTVPADPSGWRFGRLNATVDGVYTGL